MFDEESTVKEFDEEVVVVVEVEVLVLLIEL